MLCPKCHDICAGTDDLYRYADGRHFRAYKCINAKCLARVQGEETELKMCKYCGEDAYLHTVREYDNCRQEIWRCTQCHKADFNTAFYAVRIQGEPIPVMDLTEKTKLSADEVEMLAHMRDITSPLVN